MSKAGLLSEEQLQILELVDQYYCDKGKGWNKYKGETVCRIIAHVLSNHLSTSCKIICSNVFIEGLPHEFDMLILDTEPIKLTNSFEPKKPTLFWKLRKVVYFPLMILSTLKVILMMLLDYIHTLNVFILP